MCVERRHESRVEPFTIARPYNYRGLFDGGWDVLREARWRRAQANGLIPRGAGLTALPESFRSWSSLTEDERAMSARGMEVYSGMIEAMDANIGRLVARIQARGELDRTVFVVTSDNGPEPSDPVHAPGMNIWMALNGYHWDIDTLGEPGSHGFIGPEWAASVSSPSSLYKFYASEGGLRAPFVVSGPGVKPGQRVSSAAFVTDVTPTLLELAGAPVTTPPGKVAMVGRSLAPVLSGTAASTYWPEDSIGLEVSGNAALFRGGLKIVRNMPPVGDGRWRLFDLSVDPGETADLSGRRPEEFASMLRAYDAYARRSGVLDLPNGYEVERQIQTNTQGRLYRRYGWQIGLGGLGLLLAAVLSGLWLYRSAGLRRRERVSNLRKLGKEPNR